MRTIDFRSPLWASPNPLTENVILPSFEDPDPDVPICCWNLCAHQSAAKTPRYVARRNGNFQPGSYQADILSPIMKSEPSSLDLVALNTPNHPKEMTFTATEGRITRRLLIETLAPNRHVIFNPLTGAVDHVGDATLARLKQGQAEIQNTWLPSEIQELHARGYLFQEAKQEETFLEDSVTTAWHRMQTRQPAMYTICPTLACNLACAYCFEGDSLTEKKQGVMTEAQVSMLFDAIDRMRPAVEQDTPWITLFGGEPLLPSTHRCVGQILDRAANDGFLVGTITNGVNITRFEDLLSEYADIMTVFQVTLDGPRAVHDRRRHRLGGQGTFDEIVRGVDLLLFLGIDVDLRVNVDTANLDAIPELVDFLDTKGWTSHPGFKLSLAPVTDHQPTTNQQTSSGCSSRKAQVLTELEMAQGVLAMMESYPRLAEVCHMGFLRHLDYLVSVLEPDRFQERGGRKAGPRYWYCESNTDKQFVFTPEGLIYSCTEAVGKSQHAIGRFDPELDLWKEQTGQWQGRTILAHPQCRSCSISTLCGGGCNFASREQATAGSSLMQIALPGQPARVQATRSTEPFCNDAEKTIRAYLRHAGDRIFSRPALLAAAC